jgi:hypothetical protein
MAIDLSHRRKIFLSKFQSPRSQAANHSQFVVICRFAVNLPLAWPQRPTITRFCLNGFRRFFSNGSPWAREGPVVLETLGSAWCAPLRGAIFRVTMGETKISKLFDRAESWHLHVFEDADHESDAGFAIGGRIRRKNRLCPPAMISEFRPRGA